MQKWLNHKFPNGFSDLEKSLERLDTKQMGTVCRYHTNFLLKKINFQYNFSYLESDFLKN